MRCIFQTQRKDALIFSCFGFWHDVFFPIRNLTRNKNLKWNSGACSESLFKPDTLKNVQFKIWGAFKSWFKIWQVGKSQLEIWPVVFFFFWTLTSCTSFSIWNLTSKENFNSKSCFSNQHMNCNTWRFHGLKWNKTWYFDCKHFSKIWQDEKLSIEDIKGWKFSQSKIWRVIKYSSQNVTLVQKDDLKSDKL